MSNIFTYGSLMFQQVWSLVVGGIYCSAEAIITGYERKGVHDEVFPVLVPSSANSQVHGIVYYDVSSEDQARLDRFEGNTYFRKREQIITKESGVISAVVYVLKEEYYTIISHVDWDVEHFKNRGLPLFIDKYMKTLR